VALSGRVRTVTGRNRYRYPDGRDPERRPSPIPVAQPDDAPYRKPPALPKGAILVDEAWEKPRRPPRGIDVPPETDG
jgi:hypothetical protein